MEGQNFVYFQLVLSHSHSCGTPVAIEIVLSIVQAKLLHSKNRIVILTINLSCLLQMSEPI